MNDDCLIAGDNGHRSLPSGHFRDQYHEERGSRPDLLEYRQCNSTEIFLLQQHVLNSGELSFFEVQACVQRYHSRLASNRF